VAQILVAEPNRETRELLELIVSRLGFDPISREISELAGHAELEAAIIEPADPESLRLAQELRAGCPSLPIVFTSIEPQAAHARELDPAAYLLKPFRLSALTETLRGLVTKPARRPGASSG